VIPMFGVADSLNLATSTALLLYEVVRQRRG
jgi:tRNA G18 (ribose-2'-O)-methylase SpoU